MREGVKKHNMHIEPKSCELKLLGKLIVQHYLRIFEKEIHKNMTKNHYIHGLFYFLLAKA